MAAMASMSGILAAISGCNQQRGLVLPYFLGLVEGILISAGAKVTRLKVKGHVGQNKFTVRSPTTNVSATSRMSITKEDHKGGSRHGEVRLVFSYGTKKIWPWAVKWSTAGRV